MASMPRCRLAKGRTRAASETSPPFAAELTILACDRAGRCRSCIHFATVDSGSQTADRLVNRHTCCFSTLIHSVSPFSNQISVMQVVQQQHRACAEPQCSKSQLRMPTRQLQTASCRQLRQQSPCRNFSCHIQVRRSATRPRCDWGHA